MPDPATLLDACASGPELLNSERIRQRFGSYGISILDSSDGVRRSNLYSIEDGQPVCRTYAIVRFASSPESDLHPEHSEILSGRSMGEIFKARGWDIRKQTLKVGEFTALGEAPEIAALMGLDDTLPLALHVYRLGLSRRGRSVDYAEVAEIHHPDYLALADLEALYGGESGDPADALEVAGFLLQFVRAPRRN